MELLLVEDNEADIFFISMIQEESAYADKLTVLTDGASAVKYLTRADPFQNAAIPDMMILDLNLPRKSGFDILETIWDLDYLKDMKIFVLTSSENPEDRIRAKKLGVLEYFPKPTRLIEYEKVVKSIFEFAHKQTKPS